MSESVSSFLLLQKSVSDTIFYAIVSEQDKCIQIKLADDKLSKQ